MSLQGPEEPAGAWAPPLLTTWDLEVEWESELGLRWSLRRFLPLCAQAGSKAAQAAQGWQPPAQSTATAVAAQPFGSGNGLRVGGPHLQPPVGTLTHAPHSGCSAQASSSLPSSLCWCSPQRWPKRKTKWRWKAEGVSAWSGPGGSASSAAKTVVSVAARAPIGPKLCASGARCPDALEEGRRSLEPTASTSLRPFGACDESTGTKARHHEGGTVPCQVPLDHPCDQVLHSQDQSQGQSHESEAKGLAARPGCKKAPGFTGSPGPRPPSTGPRCNPLVPFAS